MASLTLRGDVYYGRHIFYVNGKRKEKKRSLDTNDEAVARRRLARWEAEIEAGRWGEPREIPFADASRRFLAERAGAIKASTLKRYAVSLRQLLPVFGETAIGKITRPDLASFVAKRRRDRGRGRGTTVSDASIRADLVCLGAILSWAVDNDWIETNPVPRFLKKKAGRVELRRAQSRTRYLSHDEEAALLAATLSGGPDSPKLRLKLHDAILFAIDTGLRADEQWRLEHRDVDHDPRSPSVFIRETKTDVPRRVYLTPRAYEALQRQLPWPGSPYVWWMKRGKKVTDLNKGMKAAAARARINTDLTWHDLRRTCGCRLIQDRGATLEQVRDFLGHSTIAVTEASYAFLSSEQLRRLTERDLIGGAMVEGKRG